MKGAKLRVCNNQAWLKVVAATIVTRRAETARLGRAAKICAIERGRPKAQAAKAVPASAEEISLVATQYERDVKAIDAPGDAASKKLKARAFDAVRAPVAGW